MGGLGSGERAKKKRTVETCFALSVAHFGKRLTQFQRFLYADMHWSTSFAGRVLTVHYRLENNNMEKPVLHLLSRTDARGHKEPMWERIVLTSTRPNFGGLRWWFVCPLLDKDVQCGRRVSKLYMPPGTFYFGCRACFYLTYLSAQTHDKRLDRLMKNPVALVEAIESKNPHERLRGLRAYAKLMRWL